MVDLQTTEHLLHFLIGNVQLSRFDEKFISSLTTQSRVTTNQVELFYKLLYKYRRQLAKHELDPDKLIYLPWQMPMVESSKQYTQGHLTIEGDKIVFKCPYNRNFITEFRANEDNPFVWDKELRQYIGNYGTYSLRFLLTLAAKYFKDIDLCPITVDLINQIAEYDVVKHWHPTLVKVNGRLMLAGLDDVAGELLKDIELNTDGKTLATLIDHGVSIDTSVYDINDPKQVFMSNYFVKHEGKDMLNIIPWLKEIECDMVCISGNTMTLTEKVKQFIAQGFPCRIINWATKHDPNEKFNRMVQLIFKTGESIQPNVAKVVQLVNSQPIEIK
jgi:hypothetical protein